MLERVLSEWPSTKGLALVCLVGLAATAAYVPAFLPLESRMKSGPGGFGIVDFEVAADYRRAERILTDWSESGAMDEAKVSVVIDYGFLVVYSLFFAGWTTWTARRLVSRPSASRWGFALVPWCFVAGLFDTVENSLGLVTLHLNRADPVRSAVMALFAGAKFTILVIVLGYCLWGLWAARSRARGAAA